MGLSSTTGEYHIISYHIICNDRGILSTAMRQYHQQELGNIINNHIGISSATILGYHQQPMGNIINCYEGISIGKYH